MTRIIQLPLDASDLKLDFNERSDGTPSWAQQAWQNIDSKQLWQYPSPDQLEARIAQYYQIDIDQVLVTNGADEAIGLLFSHLDTDRQPIIIPLPTFSMYPHHAQMMAKTVTWIPACSDGLSLDLNALENYLEALSEGPGFVVLVSPNNPTGELIAKQTVEDLLKLCQKKGLTIWLDAAYIDFSTVDYMTLIHQYDNLIVLRTLSKAFGLAGLRIGYGVGCTQAIKPLKDRVMPFNISIPAVEVGKAAFSDIAQADTAAYTAQIGKNRDHLIAQLSQWGYQCINSAANFIMVHLKPKQAQLLTNYFTWQHLKVKHFNEGALEGCVRITVPLKIEKILACLNTVLSPHLICLDMDGVLIDVKDSYDQAIICTVKYFNGQTPSAQEISKLRSQSGFNDDWTLTQALLKQQNINILRKDIIDIFQKYYLGDEKQAIKGFSLEEKPLINDHTIELLKSKTLAIITGRPRDEAKMGQALVNLPTDILVSVDDVTHPKPDPEGILQAMLNTNSQFFWMVGDNVDDMRAGTAAGALNIGIGRDRQTALIQAGAHIILDNVNQLTELMP